MPLQTCLPYVIFKDFSLERKILDLKRNGGVLIDQQGKWTKRTQNKRAGLNQWNVVLIMYSFLSFPLSFLLFPYISCLKKDHKSQTEAKIIKRCFVLSDTWLTLGTLGRHTLIRLLNLKRLPTHISHSVTHPHTHSHTHTHACQPLTWMFCI